MVVLLGRPLCPLAQQERTLEIMFGDFDVQALFLTTAESMALLNHGQ